MRCPFCGSMEDKVMDSRMSQDGDNIRRRRECLDCARRFTTYERIEVVTFKVVKRDNLRQDFDRTKILAGMFKACEKRPVSPEKIEQTVSEIEKLINARFDREVSSSEIGSMVMEKLRDIDHVAYVRYASVYRQFKDINQFVTEIRTLLDKLGDNTKITNIINNHVNDTKSSKN